MIKTHNSNFLNKVLKSSASNALLIYLFHNKHKYRGIIKQGFQFLSQTLTQYPGSLVLLINLYYLRQVLPHNTSNI